MGKNPGTGLARCLLWVSALVLSCAPGKPSDETLLVYARASLIYQEGRYPETAAMLVEERNFPPALLLRGKALFFDNQNDEAEKSFRGVLALQPGSTEAGLYLARLSREKGNFDDARALVEKMLADDPRNIRALRLAADLARDEGPSGEARALSYLNQAAEASVEAALVFMDRAGSRWARGDRNAALEDLVRAQALLPRDSPLSRSIHNLESLISTPEHLP